MAEGLGEFEHRVLLTILRQGGESYSVPIVLELEELTGREVSPAAVYIALRRLEDKGMVSSRKEAAPPEEGGRERRYFALEEPALEALRQARRALLQLWDGVAAALDEPT